MALSYKNDPESDSRLNPAEHLKSLEADYEKSLSEQDVNQGTDALENYANDPANATPKGALPDKPANSLANINKVRSDELNAPWANNTGSDLANKTTRANNSTRFNLNALKSKKSATGLIISLVFGGSLLGAGLLSPGLLIVHLKEDLVNKFDTRSSFMQTRSNRILNSKLGNLAGKASCTTVNVLCKMNTPSTEMLNKIKDQGGEIVDKKGNPIAIEADAKYQSLPDDAKIRFPDSGDTVAVKDFANTIDKDPVKGGFFRKVFNPKFSAYNDSAFGKVLNYFKISKANSLGDETDQKKMQSTIDDTVQNGEKPNNVSIATEEEVTDENGKKVPKQTDAGTIADLGGGTATDAAKAAESISEDLTKKVTKAGPAGLVIGLFCGAQDFSKMISTATRAQQIAQYVRFGMVFLTTADMIKAGTAKPEQVAYLGTVLTTVLKDSKGNITKKSATDGYGLKYGLGQGLPPKTLPKGSTSRFTTLGTPGGGLGALTAFANPPSVIKSFCLAANSTAGQLIIGLTGGPSGLFGAAIGIAAAPLVAPLIAPLIEKLIASLAGDALKGAVGEDAGDALASGSSQMMSATAAAGGGVGLSVSQAVAYERDINQPYRVAQASIDRATLSPFDASNQNTFLGSIYNNLLPSYSDVSSLSGIVSIPFTILGTSFGLVNNSVYAADDGYGTSAEYDPSQNSCGDPNLIDSGVATGPLCNIINALPVSAINRNPDDVLSALQGQYDETTGEPTSGALKQYSDDCVNKQQDPDTAKECFNLDKDNNNNLSLFIADQSVQKNMDGEDPGINTSGSTSATDTGDVGSGDFTDNGEVKGFATVLANGELVNSTYGEGLVGKGSCARITSRIWHGSPAPYGYTGAIDLWTAKGASVGHTDRNVPKGALLLYRQDPGYKYSQYGHVDIYIGNNKVLNDGAIMDADYPEKHWADHFVGWIDPNDIGWTTQAASSVGQMGL